MLVSDWVAAHRFTAMPHDHHLLFQSCSSQRPLRFGCISEWHQSRVRSATVGKTARLSIYWLDAACGLVIPLRQVALAQLYKYHHQSSNVTSGKLVWKQHEHTLTATLTCSYHSGTSFYEPYVHWSSPNRRKLWGSSLSTRKCNLTKSVRADVEACVMLILRACLLHLYCVLLRTCFSIPIHQGLRASSLQFTSPLQFNAIFRDSFTLRHELTAGSKIRDPVPAKFKHVTNIVTCTCTMLWLRHVRAGTEISKKLTSNPRLSAKNTPLFLFPQMGHSLQIFV